MERDDQLAPSEITLYVVPHCPLCDQARAWLNSHGHSYVERDVSADFGALRSMYRLTHQRYVPVVQIGDRYSVRPSSEELATMLPQ